MTITNPRLVDRTPLEAMYDDVYFPDHVVDKARDVLERLAARIEAERPADLPTLYTLTCAATDELNALESEFDAVGSEIDTIGRELLCEEFVVIANAYGYQDADVEELTATREW